MSTGAGPGSGKGGVDPKSTKVDPPGPAIPSFGDYFSGREIFERVRGGQKAG